MIEPGYSVALAGTDVDRNLNVLKVGLGKWVPGSKGGWRPDKYWGLRVFRGESKDRHGHLNVHEEATRALLEAAGLDSSRYVGDDKTDPKTRKCPIELWSNKIEDSFKAGRGLWWGGRPWCRCNLFAQKTFEWAAGEDGDGLPWMKHWAHDQNEAAASGRPWPPKECEGDEVYLHGIFTRNDLWGARDEAAFFLNPEGDAQKWRGRCDPTTCPMANGTHGMKKYAGVKLCKPDLRFNFAINIPGFKGEFGYATSVGWNTAGATSTSWRRRFEQCDDWIKGVPLLLTLGGGTAHPESMAGQKKQSVQIPILRFDLACDLDEAKAIAAQRKAAALGPAERRQLAEYERTARLLPGTPNFRTEKQQEHHPEVPVDAPQQWEIELRSLLKRIDEKMTPAAIKAEIAKARPDPEAALRSAREFLDLEQPEEPPEEVPTIPDEPGEIRSLFADEDTGGHRDD
jgi:hypothetical protein